MSFPSQAAVETPRPKEQMPPLDAREPRPRVVRLRRSVVAVAVIGACGLLAGSLAWAFVLEPRLRDHAAHKAKAPAGDGQGAVRPTDLVTGAPASYSQLDQLPAPRRLGVQPAAQAPGVGRPPPRPPVSAGRSAGSQARQSSVFFASTDAAEKASAATSTPAPADAMVFQAARQDYAAVYNGHTLLAPLSPYELKAGTVIPASLMTAVDTAREGPVVATVTDNVYDTVSGRTLLVPQGSRLIGAHEGESRYGDDRAFLTWDRLILPNGKSLTLTREPGVDAQGAIGAPGQVDRRLGSLAVATLFAGAITTLGQVARDHDQQSGGVLGDAGDAAAIQGAETGGKLIQRELDVRPQVKLTPGTRVRVLITRDLVLEPYQP